MRGKKCERPVRFLLFPFALSSRNRGLEKWTTRQAETDEAAHCGDQRTIIKRDGIVLAEVDCHIDKVGEHSVSCGREKEDTVHGTPGTAFPEKRNARGNREQLISNRVRNVEVMVVIPQLTRQQPVGVNEEGKKVERVEDQDGEIQQPKRAEPGIVHFLGLHGSGRHQGNQSHEQKNVGDWHIRDCKVKPQFMGRPDQQAGQRHYSPYKLKEPECSDLGMASNHVLKSEKRKHCDQADFQEVAEQTKLKTFGKSLRRDEGEENGGCHKGVAKQQGPVRMPAFFGWGKRRVVASFHDRSTDTRISRVQPGAGPLRPQADNGAMGNLARLNTAFSIFLHFRQMRPEFLAIVWRRLSSNPPDTSLSVPELDAELQRKLYRT